MLERLISQTGAMHLDRTLHIAAAYASHKDPLPGLAIVVLAMWDSDTKEALNYAAHLTGMLHRRVNRRITCEREDCAKALVWWLTPECETCHGLKHETLPDAPSLAEALCPSCFGSGRRPHTAGSKGYAAALELLDGAYEWARLVGKRMPEAYKARLVTEAA